MKPLLHSALIISLACSLFIFARAQQTTSAPAAEQKAAPTPQPPAGEDVVRITTNLVQLDVTVVDKSGQPVADLTPEDFEVVEDGRPQKVMNLSFIKPATSQRSAATPSTTPKHAKGVPPTPPPPPVTLRPEQVRRAFALVVDDLGLSFESSHHVRESLKKFVDEEMQPGDLVAIIRTGAGMGALQQFTADKRQLYAAIERVRYNLNSRTFNAFGPIEDTARIAGPNSGTRGSDADKNQVGAILDLISPGKAASQYRDDIFSVGTLGALNFIIRGLRELPGRKSIVLFSDGFRMYDEDEGSRRILDSMNRLIDLANRASVVIYTVDPRGVQTRGLTAADDLSGPIAPGNGNFSANNGDSTPGQWMMSTHSDLANGRLNFLATQQGLGYLAQQTGGLFIGNTNDTDGALRKVLGDQKGYYLLGYRPDEATFNAEGRRAGFHHVQVKVRRAGLTVRTRAGFYGFTDEERARPTYRTPSDQLYAAISSPFSAGGIRLRMSSVFGYDAPRNSSFTESILHIDARDITFNQQEDGTYKASFQILAATFGDNGNVIDQAMHGYSLTLTAAELEQTRASGLIYVVTLPIKKPGPYQLRMAIRDNTTTRVGSANQFMEVPDVKKKRLTLSGIMLSASDPQPAATTAPTASTTPTAKPASSLDNSQSASRTPESAPPNASAPASTNGEAASGALRSQATRHYHHRQKLSFVYYIYNARLDSSRRPQLATQVRLFRDGQLVYTGQQRDFNTASQADLKQIISGGELTLGTDLPAGAYVLQVIVRDKLASGDATLATAWMDFELSD